MSLNDQILAERRQTWHGVGRLLFWGSIHALVFTLITVLFAINGPTATIWFVSFLLVAGNVAITAYALLTRK
jgi:hypothetical protein